MKKRNTILPLLFVLITVLLLSACSKDAAPSPSPIQPFTSDDASGDESAIQTAEPEVTPEEFYDRAGNVIVIPEKAEKIVSMSPTFTQILTELGLGDKIIAVDTYSAGTEGIAENLPAFDMFSPDIEALLALQPDIVIASGMSIVSGDDPFKPARDAGACVAYIPVSNSIEEIKGDILFIGEVTGTFGRAVEIVSEIDAEIARIEEITATIPNDEKKKVYFEIAAAPEIYTFGNGVFLNEMITILGAENIFSNLDGWLAVSEEAVVNANPDVILTSVNYIDNPVGEILARNGWENVNAVINGQVYYINNNASSQPNHNILIALREMALAVYPDKFGE